MNEPLWLRIAQSFNGVREIPGPKSERLILEWARNIGAPSWYDDDDKAWCAIFVNHVLKTAGLPLSGVSFELIRAKSFEEYGIALKSPVYGSILVFWRPTGFHVGFYLGENESAFYVLGGNQGNAVSRVWI